MRENKQLTCLAISLRCLKHPLTLASVGLLLLNDHLLKTAVPSFLTGKLSDLAGLFFFPFLLAAFFSLPLDRLRLARRSRSRCTVALAFGLTLLWFTLVKTWSVANVLTVTALSRVLGSPVQIVRDPTDLLALVVLWPAWRLWMHLEWTPSRKPPGRVAHLALGLASLATLASSCEESPVTHLVVFEHSVYADVGYVTPARSDDGGRTWTLQNDPEAVPPTVSQQLGQPARLPVTVCESGNPQTCYRITGAEKVEGSLDGGETWREVWRVPWGRKKYMERFIHGMPVSCKWRLDLAPYDLALLNRNGASTLVVAMGDEGVLVRTPEGTWHRYEVFAAGPTPYAGGDSWVLFWLLLGENGLSVIAAILVWWACCIVGWKSILSKTRLPPERSIRWAIAPFFWPAMLLLLSGLPVYLLLTADAFDPVLLLIPGAAILIFVLVGPALAWRRVASVSPRPAVARQSARACARAAAGVFPLAWLPFPLWVFGLIPVYELALALSMFIGMTSLVWGIHCVRRTSHMATMSSASEDILTG